MKKLFIVRHAKSSWDFPELDDYDRPLSKRGKKNAPEMGKRLADKGIIPDKMITSPAKRAAATARRIAEEIEYSRKKIHQEPLLYHGSITDMVNVIKNVGEEVNTLMIFGHNPSLTDLVNFLSKSDIYNIPTCGIAEIEFNIDSWKGVERGIGKLASFDYPKKVSSRSH